MHNPTMEIDEQGFKKLGKLQFIENALCNGWSVRKRGDKYVFRRKHNGELRVFNKVFISEFINENCLLSES